MDSLPAIGPSLPPRQVRSLTNRDVESASFAQLMSPADPNPAAALDPAQRGDPATEHQRMLHFISHVDAECFISLLQTADPVPDDSRARAEYRRFYRHLGESLEVPLPPPDAQPLDMPAE
jgi:hypothetical protein